MTVDGPVSDNCCRLRVVMVTAAAVSIVNRLWRRHVVNAALCDSYERWITWQN